MSKLLTISIPTYNRASMLDAQLAWLSAELEGYENDCEVIISDNCSDDKTPDVIDAWKRRLDGRISFTAHRNDHNVGGMANIIQSIGMASGTFVWSLGDDDSIQRGAVTYILRNIKDHPSLSLVLLNGCGRDMTTGKIIQERWFDSVSDVPSRHSATEFEVVLERHMGGVLFISSAVYRTKLVHRAFATWPDCRKNVASQAYWVAYCAAHGVFIVTPDLFTECAMGIGFTDKDPKWPFTVVFRGLPEVYLRLMRSGYSRGFCFRMMLRNIRSFTAWRVLIGSFRRWPVYAACGVGYYVYGIFVGTLRLLSHNSRSEPVEG